MKIKIKALTCLMLVLFMGLSVFAPSFSAWANSSLNLKSSSYLEVKDGYLINVKSNVTVSELISHFENSTACVFNCDGALVDGNAVGGTGFTVSPTENATDSNAVTVVIKGDLTSDGVVDATDYVRIKSNFFETLTLTGAFLVAGDVDESGTVDSTDYMRVKSHFLGKFELFPETSPEVSEEPFSEEYFEVLYEKDQVIYNDIPANSKAPTYYQDFTKSDIVNTFKDVYSVNLEFVNEGFTRFTALSGDPYVDFAAPNLLATKMKYVAIEYRTSVKTKGEFYVDIVNSDGSTVANRGQNGTNISWSWGEATGPDGEFKKIVVDISSLCKSGQTFKAFRFDAATTNNAVVDVKYVATFSKLSDAEAFTLDNYRLGSGTKPTYIQDLTVKETLNNFTNARNVTIKHNDNGFVRFKPYSDDPYLTLEKPDVLATSMKYIAIGYRTSIKTSGEFYVDITKSNGKDGAVMGAEGTHVTWDWGNPTGLDGEFSKIVVDISSICVSKQSFKTFRIDVATNANAVVDIQYIAGFKSKSAANAFVFEDFYSGAYNADGEVEWPDPVYVEKEVNENVPSSVKVDSLKLPGEYRVSYTADGQTYESYVNGVNYISGGFAGVDDLGRKLVDSSVNGVYGTNGEFYVGMFYFLWMGEHGDRGIYDNNKIIEQYGAAAKYLSCGAWGPEGAMHFWGEPLYGYYYSSDEWVMRKHMELLTNASIDFLYFDITNGYPYLESSKKLMKILHQMNLQGFDAPQVVFYTKTDSKAMVQTIYNEIYGKNYYPDTWFRVDGKPVVIAYEEDNINNFFTIRLPQWPNEAMNEKASWPWMDFSWPQRVFQNNGVGEAISVSVAQHSGSVRFSSSALYGDTSNRGRSTTTATEDKSKVTEDSVNYGYNFQAQWDRVFKCIKNSATDAAQRIKYVLVTGWNEWVAQRQSSTMFPGEEIVFIDTITTEYSRDIEMTRGLYFDNYYMQLVKNVAKLKGSPLSIIEDGRKSINVTGDFSQWNDVAVTYKDVEGDCADRVGTTFARGEASNYTGRNDIVSAKVINDSEFVYFYAETAHDISMFDTDSSWMQLFVNTDKNGKNGWYGYDYIINYKASDCFTTTVAKNVTKGAYSFKTIGEVSYRVKDNKMMIAVPLEMLGITDSENISIEFKWADSTVKITNMEGFYELGDSAPLGRLNWIFKNN